MLLEALLALTTVMPRLDAGIETTRTRTAAIEWPALPAAQPPALPYFSATARAVSNWRDETGTALMPTSLALVAKYSGTDPGFIARCVKLNNYWCIKQARWAGELGGDADGHTGFASAADGADAAALLLRRYYRDFNRRTALAIVRRWAPAECGMPRPVAVSRRTPAAGPKVSTALAPRGIGGTLRARFLAGRGRGGAPRGVTVTRFGNDGGLRVQPWSARARLAGHPRTGPRAVVAKLPPLKPVADIAAGITPPGIDAPRTTQVGYRRVGAWPAAPAAPAALRSIRPALVSGPANPAALLSSDRLVAESAALPSIVAGLPGGSLLDLRVPAPLCSTDETRIRNYASRIAASVGLKPEDNLELFEPDGTPTQRLAPVMLAMSSVELGSLQATPALIAAAIARLSLRPAAATASAADGMAGTVER